MAKSFSIWEGVYQSFSEIPTEQNVFNEHTWVQNLEKKFYAQKEAINKNDFLSELGMTFEHPLSVVLAMLSIHQSKIEIVDFGGGLATAYFQAKQILNKRIFLNFHIVECEELVKIGQAETPEFSEINFYTENPKLEQVDVLNFGSSLQYIENWQALLNEYMASQPHMILLSDLLAGNIPTFVSSQEYYGNKIPMWFWNINDILSFFEDTDYELIYKSQYRGQYLGERQPLLNQGLPHHYQIKDTCDLIFSRVSS